MSQPYTFDLLGGKGIPPKSGPTTITIVALTVCVPLIAIIMLAITYTDNRIALSVKEKSLAKLVSVTSTMDKALQKREDIEKKIKTKKEYLSEIATIIDKRIPWSPVLTTIGKHLPDSLTLDAFDATFKITQKQIPSKSNPKKRININIPTKNLKISIHTQNVENADMAVKDYQNRLHNSPVLRSQLEPIIISRESRVWDNKDTVYYKMDCNFKTE